MGILILLLFLGLYVLDYFFVSKPRLKKKQVQLAKNKNYERLYILKGSECYDRIREVDFSRKILFWDENGVDTTYFALDIFNKLSFEIPRNDKDKIIDYLRNDLYNEADGGFKQTEAFPYSTVHATHCGIGVIKQIHDNNQNEIQIDYQSPMGFDVIKDVLGNDRAEKVFSFVQKCESQEGGFRESYNEKKLPTVNDTATALWIYWHMNRMDQCNSKKIIELIKSCFKEVDKGKCGFSNTINDRNSVWICTTYYANRLSEYKCFKPISDFILSNLGCLENFVMNSLHKNGGFGADNKLEPNVIHTKDALSLLRQWKYFDNKKELCHRVVKGIENFMGSCYANGGYAFAETNYYTPNIYATRLALDIKDYIERFNKDRIVSSNIDIDEERVFEFVNSCYDKRIGAFKGYPSNRENLFKVA